MSETECHTKQHKIRSGEKHKHFVNDRPHIKIDKRSNDNFKVLLKSTSKIDSNDC